MHWFHLIYLYSLFLAQKTGLPPPMCCLVCLFRYVHRYSHKWHNYRLWFADLRNFVSYISTVFVFVFWFVFALSSLSKTTGWIKFWRQAVGGIQASPPTVWRQPSNCPAGWSEGNSEGVKGIGGKTVRRLSQQFVAFNWLGFHVVRIEYSWISWKGETKRIGLWEVTGHLANRSMKVKQHWFVVSFDPLHLARGHLYILPFNTACLFTLLIFLLVWCFRVKILQSWILTSICRPIWATAPHTSPALEEAIFPPRLEIRYFSSQWFGFRIVLFSFATIPVSKKCLWGVVLS